MLLVYLEKYLEILQRFAIATILTMYLTRPLKVLKIYDAYVGYTRLSPLFDEMSLGADSDERKLYLRRLDTRFFYYLHG